MLGGILLQAICDSQESIGYQMSTDAISAENVSQNLVKIQQHWAKKYDDGRDITDISEITRDPNDPMMPEKATDPQKPVIYTTDEIQFMITYIAGQEQNPDIKGDDLTKLQSESSTWSNLNGAMQNLADLMKAPFNTMQQGEASQIQQDQSAVSGSSSLGTGLADLDAIPSSLVPNIGG